MIVSKDINPERDLYYLGAVVVELISNQSNSSVDFFNLYNDLNLHKKISMELYSLTLDWLYLNGVIENSTDGSIKKCF